MRTTLTQLADKHGTDKGTLHEGHRYTHVYERYISRQVSTLLEIGVNDHRLGLGASTRMFAEYLPNSFIVGLDINIPDLKMANSPSYNPGDLPNKHILRANQNNLSAMHSVARIWGPFDVIIDDGEHSIRSQIRSLMALWDRLEPTGLYFVEDCHTHSEEDMMILESFIDRVLKAKRFLMCSEKLLLITRYTSNLSLNTIRYDY